MPPQPSSHIISSDVCNDDPSLSARLIKQDMNSEHAMRETNIQNESSTLLPSGKPLGPLHVHAPMPFIIVLSITDYVSQSIISFSIKVPLRCLLRSELKSGAITPFPFDSPMPPSFLQIKAYNPSFKSPSLALH